MSHIKIVRKCFVCLRQEVTDWKGCRTHSPHSTPASSREASACCWPPPEPSEASASVRSPTGWLPLRSASDPTVSLAPTEKGRDLGVVAHLCRFKYYCTQKVARSWTNATKDFDCKKDGVWNGAKIKQNDPKDVSVAAEEHLALNVNCFVFNTKKYTGFFSCSVFTKIDELVTNHLFSCKYLGVVLYIGQLFGLEWQAIQSHLLANLCKCTKKTTSFENQHGQQAYQKYWATFWIRIFLRKNLFYSFDWIYASHLFLKQIF